MSLDEELIRALIATWGEASSVGDLATQLSLMTKDVVFLAAGHPPMRRETYETTFTSMMKSIRLRSRSEVQEVVVDGDLAVSWSQLSVEITPLAGGATRKYAGPVLTMLRREDDGVWRIARDANMLAAAV